MMESVHTGVKESAVVETDSIAIADLNEVQKMLEASVEVGLRAHGFDVSEVRVVDVCVDAEHPLQNRLHL